MRGLPFKTATKPNAAMERYGDWVSEQPCVVTGRYGVQRHHPTAGRDGGRFSRSHWLQVPLVPELHQIIYGPAESVEALGHSGFYDTHGVDLEIEGLWTLLRYLETERV